MDLLTAAQAVGSGADASPMRALLEFLGIVDPDRGRKEPVALPSWGRWLPHIAAVVFSVACTVIVQILRALV